MDFFLFIEVDSDLALTMRFVPSCHLVSDIYSFQGSLDSRTSLHCLKQLHQTWVLGQFLSSFIMREIFIMHVLKEDEIGIGDGRAENIRTSTCQWRRCKKLLKCVEDHGSCLGRVDWVQSLLLGAEEGGDKFSSPCTDPNQSRIRIDSLSSNTYNRR